MSDWRPTASLPAIKARAALLADIRGFFSERGVIEVETPLLSHHGNPDPAISSMRTSDYWLRTSPEFPIKRLLAAGVGDCFELGRVFREAESGHNHNPEFTMLEWYRVDWKWQELVTEVIALLRFCGGGGFDDWPAEMRTYGDLFHQHTGLNPHHCTIAEAQHCAASLGVNARSNLSLRQWQDLLFASVVQAGMPKRGITVVHDFPADQAALARIRVGNPPVAERFEVFLGQSELANGYQELTDANEQLQRFNKENETRGQQGQTVAEPDHRLVAALAAGLPECSGVALGVDRLLMQLCNADSINEVLAFPIDRA